MGAVEVVMLVVVVEERVVIFPEGEGGVWCLGVKNKGGRCLVFRFL